MVQRWGCARMPGVFLGSALPCSSLPRHVTTAQQRRLDSCRTLAQADDAAKDASNSQSRANALTGTIKRKQKQMADLLQDLGVETLEDRLQSATASPAIPSHRFAQLIQVTGDSNARCSIMPVECPRLKLDCLMSPAYLLCIQGCFFNTTQAAHTTLSKAIALHTVSILPALLCTSGQHPIRQASLGS